MAMFKQACLASLLLVACADVKMDTASGTLGDVSASGSTGGSTAAQISDAGDTGATGGPTSTAAFDSSSTAGEESTGTTALGSTTEPAPPQECSPWLEDCPDGQKCAAYGAEGDVSWSAYKCVPIAPRPAQLDEPCTVADHALSGEDSCDEHLMCWKTDAELNGVCVPMCTGSADEPSCADEDDFCAISDDGVLLLCLPTCDPFQQDCAAGEACIPHPGRDVFACVPDLGGDEGQLFDPCEFANWCDPGLACIPSELASECDPGAAGCCLPFCDTSQPDNCPGVGQVCKQAFEDPPPKYEHAGICALP
jgi:hypothetical protein